VDAPKARTAAAPLSARSKRKGRIALLLGGGLRLLDGVDDVGIGGAAAEIAAHVFADSGLVVGMTFVHAGNRRHDLPRRAVAALERVVVDEGLLHRMQLAVRAGEAFDRGDALSLRGSRKRQAGKHAAAIEQHRAGAALTVIAALLGS